MGAAPVADVLTTKTPVYRLCRVASALAFHTFLPCRVEGTEHLPAEGGALIASNHQSVLDIPLISVTTRRHVSFVARDSLAQTRWLAYVMRQCGAVLIRRGAQDRAALREMVAHLEAGDIVSIFPEGTRTRDGRVQPFRRGALLPAKLAGVPVVPAGIRGTFTAWPRGASFLRPARVAVRFAAPVDPRAADATARVQSAIEQMVGDGFFEPVHPRTA
jgi:1-acyl-sn-glycerol-3-phosphate acyltransferase